MTTTDFLLPERWQNLLQRIETSSRIFWERERRHGEYLRLQSHETWRSFHSWLTVIEEMLIPKAYALTPFERFLLYAATSLCEVGWQEIDAPQQSLAERYTSSSRRILASASPKRGETDLGLANVDITTVEVLATLCHALSLSDLTSLKLRSEDVPGGYDQKVRIRYLSALLQLANLLFIRGRVNDTKLKSLLPLDATNIPDARLALEPYLAMIDLQKDGLKVYINVHAADEQLAEKMYDLFIEPLRIWWAANWAWLYRDYDFFFPFLPPDITLKSESPSILPLSQTCPSLKLFLEQFQASKLTFPAHITDIIPEPIPQLQLEIPRRSSAFIVYSNKDHNYFLELEEQLMHYIRQDGLDIWDENKMLAGSKRKQEIEQALQKTKVAVVLVSSKFLASDFIVESILPPLLLAAEQDGAIILPVIIGTCAIEETDLAQFQPANDASRPLNLVKKARREIIWREVALRVRKALKA